MTKSIMNCRIFEARGFRLHPTTPPLKTVLMPDARTGLLPAVVTARLLESVEV
jgi:hypothetical protein